MADVYATVYHGGTNRIGRGFVYAIYHINAAIVSGSRHVVVFGKVLTGVL